MFQLIAINVIIVATNYLIDNTIAIILLYEQTAINFLLVIFATHDQWRGVAKISGYTCY